MRTKEEKEARRHAYLTYELGARLEKREDRFGDTYSGWWLDEVYLGKDCRSALEAVGCGTVS